MDDLKQTFLHNEIWLLSFGGAFQHVKIYKENIKETEKLHFRKELKGFIIEHILPQYNDSVCEFSHILNIEAIIVFSEKWSNILNNGKLLLGVSQKLLNLVLKYYWCLGEIEEPPHCPIDRIIQVNGLKSKNIINWTSISDVNVYLNIIHQVQEQANIVGKSIAEWELEEFSRVNIS